ncbi:hypothetical protein A5625_08065 [Mycobacterium sp. 1465703.0]|nr:hypothetical protein A5625_08065 [Mycobacterium sp. 1465703.0]
MMHRRRYTRRGLQCTCGAPFWSWRHIIAYELGALAERIRYHAPEWFRVRWRAFLWYHLIARVK